MAATTYRSFVDALEALSITGVSRQFTQGPPLGSPGVADCPAQYVRYPSGDESPIVLGEQLGWRTLRAEVVVLVEPVGQDTAFANFDATVDMMDAMLTALQGASCICVTKLQVTSVRQVIDTVAGQDYWAVVIAVECHG